MYSVPLFLRSFRGTDDTSELSHKEHLFFFFLNWTQESKLER